MSANLLLDNFHALAEAPNGVQQLRALILRLAIRGKLASQDSKEENAEGLLKRVLTNRNKTLVGTKSKKNPLLPIDSNELIFPVPNGWVWTRLGMIADAQAGFAFDSVHFNQAGHGIPLIRIRDISNSTTVVCYDGSFREEFVVTNGDQLIGMDGDFNIRFWKGKKALLNQRVTRLRYYSDDVLPKFVGPALQERLAEIQGSKSYTTVDHLSTKQIEAAMIPLPPLSEQRRIVAKADQLMALCDELEKRQEKKHQVSIQLNESALNKLATSKTSEGFAVDWQRIKQNFDLLYDTPENVSKLKQAILQLAVQGKLVPQDPKDEPASVLLEKIKVEKERLIRERKIKHSKPLPPISPDEVPFQLPKGWVWCWLGEIATILRGSSPRPKGDRQYFSETKTNNNWITISDITNFCADSILMQTREFLTDLGTEYSTFVYKNEFVIAVSGSTTGKCCLTGITGYIYDGLALVRLSHNEIMPRFFLQYMRQLYSFINESKEGSAFPNINTEFLKLLPFPLPPFHEQKRIVAKIAELIAICDELETKLTHTQSASERLVESVVRGVVG